MASLRYLWKHRATPRFASHMFFRCWAKRLLLLRVVLQRNRRRKWLIRKGAEIHELAEVGEAKFAGPKKNLVVGNSSFIGKAYCSLREKIIIGERVCINDLVEIHTASHDVSSPDWPIVAAPVVIEDYAWIGAGAFILPGVTIGRGAVVGARSVVTKSVPPGAVIVGNPGRLTGKTRPQDLAYNPCEFLAPNRAWLVEE